MLGVDVNFLNALSDSQRTFFIEQSLYVKTVHLIIRRRCYYLEADCIFYVYSVKFNVNRTRNSRRYSIRGSAKKSSWFYP